MDFPTLCKIVTIFIFCFTGALCSNQCPFVQNITGSSYKTKKYKSSYVIRALTNSGPKMCIRDCLLQHECNGVNYNSNKNCELLATQESDKTTSTNGYYYSSITNWTMVSGNLIQYV